MAIASQNIKQMPLEMVGSSVFGRYSKISNEQTYNMYISDDFLVNYAGYKNVLTIAPNGRGRGIFNSARFNHLIAVIDNGVYIINSSLAATRIGSLSTFNGDVFMDENDNAQIAICDKSSLYVFNYANDTFQNVPLDFVPGYVKFQDGYLIAPELGRPEWRLSGINDALTWPAGANNVGEFQTKPDNCVACVRIPGQAGNLFVMGSTVTEPWTDTAYTNGSSSQLFPYKRSTSLNIDYGCLNPATIAESDTFVVFLGGNEKSGPAIMYSSGGPVQQISTDGINFKLSNLNNPSNSYAFLFKQDGHLFYQITFADPSDNLTYAYDFNTKRFFTLTDQNMNAHIAKRVAFFNDNYYFLSSIDGNIYLMDSTITNYDGNEIPRIRVCKTMRMPDSSPFVAQNLNFIIEQGDSANKQRVDMSVSRDGGETFSSYVPLNMNSLGNRRNKAIYYSLGYGNELTPQFRFWGDARFVVSNGMLGVYQ